MNKQTKVGNTPVAKRIDVLMRQNEIEEIKDLADRSGMNQPTLYRIYTGEIREPKTSTLKPLAAFFGVTVPQLRGEEFYSEANPDVRISAKAREIAKKWDKLPSASKHCIAQLIDTLSSHHQSAAAKQRE